MRLDEEQESTNYEVQRGGGSGLGGFGGGGGGLFGMLVPLIASRFGMGGIIVAVIAIALFNGAGGLLSGGGSGAGSSGENPSGFQNQKAPAQGALTDLQHLSLKVLGSTERVWGQIFQENGQRYTPTILSFYSSSGQSGCGAAQSAMGPFYCPVDKKIYLDTDFYNELRQRFGAPGDFAQAYVIAHEVGHHIQDLAGTLDNAHERQRQLGTAAANAVQVQVELQADCYAGVWGKRTGLMEAGDMEEGLRAAKAIGDDTLQRQAGQRPMPDSFTHGTSEQRMTALRSGLESGDPATCDTYHAGS
ncbi:MAG: neutral zinc metallopeptidase [Sphingobium sp.]|nr:neutral zinc metallopeptidase [Sphingobium sp.]